MIVYTPLNCELILLEHKHCAYITGNRSHQLMYAFKNILQQTVYNLDKSAIYRYICLLVIVLFKGYKSNIIMSFRWNMSMRQPSDKSFMQYGNQLVATSIGITSNRTMLSCVMNMDAKQYKYYKSDAQILEAFANIYNKHKQYAFRQIQKSTHYHRDVTNTIFLPEALNNGNYDAMSKFLQKLRTNRVGAYVKLNLQESKGYFQKAATLIKPTTKIIRERLRFSFIKLKRNLAQERENEQKGLILDQLDKISNIQNKDSECSAKDHEKSKLKSSVIKISYRLLKINPQTTHSLTKKKELGESMKEIAQKDITKQIRVDQLMTSSPIRQYQFEIRK